MQPIRVVAHSERYLSFAERKELALLKAERLGVREIARRMGRSLSTVSRELRRNAATPRLCIALSDHGRRADRRWGTCWSSKLISRKGYAELSITHIC